MEKKQFIGVVAFILAALSLIFAIYCFSVNVSANGSYEENKSYGGDAYTGMQNASAQAANNALNAERTLCKLINTMTTVCGMGFVLVTVAGAAVGVHCFGLDKKIGALPKVSVTVTPAEPKDEVAPAEEVAE